jgi:heme/copper-type cytochrome/quinol oxidase subunit 3
VSTSAATNGLAPYEREDPSVVARNLTAGIWLLISALGFVFMALVFAFFYLRAVNSNGLWRPPHTDPPQGWGIATLVLVLATAAAFELARRGLRQATDPAWRWSMWAALTLGVVAVVVQVIQILDTSFSVYDGGGYASVYYGYLAMFLAIWLGAVYWVETVLATAIRRLPNPETPDADPITLLLPSADACIVYLYMTAAVAVIFYVLLYLIK